MKEPICYADIKLNIHCLHLKCSLKLKYPTLITIPNKFTCVLKHGKFFIEISFLFLLGGFWNEFWITEGNKGIIEGGGDLSRKSLKNFFFQPDRKARCTTQCHLIKSNKWNIGGWGEGWSRIWNTDCRPHLPYKGTFPPHCDVQGRGLRKPRLPAIGRRQFDRVLISQWEAHF